MGRLGCDYKILHDGVSMSPGLHCTAKIAYTIEPVVAGILAGSPGIKYKTLFSGLLHYFP